ncbi:MAG: hypothetical protein WEB19_02160 [Acidimicrobiia bacterium]
MRRLALLALLPLLLVACRTDTPPPANGAPGLRPVEVLFEFAAGDDHGWEAGFSDYSPQHGDLGFESGIAPLPASLDREGSGFRLGGMNRSDDLFMYMKRRLSTEDDVIPGQAYRVTYRVLFASDAPVGCAGIGGAPGESVFLKMGATAEEPETVLQGDMYTLTVDKGEQATGGREVWVTGDIANGIDCEEALDAGSPHAEVERTYQHDGTVTAGEDGTLWLIVGTDSGFEGFSDLYYIEIEVLLEPVH